MVKILTGVPNVRSVQLSNPQSANHFFQPVLVIDENRVAWGNPIFYQHICYDVDSGLTSLRRRFRTGSSFSLALRFVLFLPLAGQAEPKHWIHLPGSPSSGICFTPDGNDRDQILSLLSDPLPLGKAVDLLSSLIPEAVHREGDTARCLDARSPRLSLTPCQFPERVVSLAVRCRRGLKVDHITEATYFGSELWTIANKPSATATSVIALPS